MKTWISRLILLLLILVGTVGCDQTTKHIARTALAHQKVIDLSGRIGSLQLAENPGGHLSFGATWSRMARTASFIFLGGLLVLVLASFLIWKPPSGFQFACLALSVGGGTSNLIDRVFRDGMVTDFIYLHLGWFHTGIFNLADVLISAGSIGFLVASISEHALKKWKRR